MDTTLIIMAAGIGSRYGGGIKQLAAAGPNGEIIMDYSIFDALRAGFTKIVFVIRKDIEKDFREIVGDRVSAVCKTEYVFQDLNAIPAGYTVPEDRKKPWGTGQAILAAKSVVNEPFCVINADDFYGAGAFRTIHEYLVKEPQANGKEPVALVGYVLKNTLSENGTVSRGICSVDENDHLVSVDETHEIGREPSGNVTAKDGDGKKTLDENCLVSMNMWGFRPGFFNELDDKFVSFFEGLKAPGTNPAKAEYLLPAVVDGMAKDGRAVVDVLSTDEKWFGVTYHEDMPVVTASVKKLIADGVYPNDLYAALKKN